MPSEIEIFSPEAFVIGACGILLLLSSTAQVAALYWQGLSALNDRFDRIVHSMYRQAKVIPPLLLALLIAIIAPAYEMLADTRWADAIYHASAGRPSGNPASWAELVQYGHDGKTLRNLIHVIQIALGLGALWLFSLIWCDLIERTDGRGETPSTPLARAGFLSGFGAILTMLAYFVQWIGQHPAFILHIPLAVPHST